MAAQYSDEKDLSEYKRACMVGDYFINSANSNQYLCSADMELYGRRVIAAYRVMMKAVNDKDFTCEDYGAADSAQVPADLNSLDAARAACALALSDSFFGPPERPRLLPNPPSCSEDMVVYGLRLMKDYTVAVRATDPLP